MFVFLILSRRTRKDSVIQIYLSNHFPIQVTIFSLLLATACCQTNSEPPTSENPFVPGVFITADALKSLQEKAKQPENNPVDAEAGPPKVSKNSDQLTSSPNLNLPDQSNPDQSINQPIGNQQNYPEQQQQPMLNQPAYYNPQPGYNQQLSYQQPGYQQAGFPQNGIGILPYVSNQQGILVGQQPGYQNPQGVLLNQQSPYQQPILVAQQPNQQLFIPNGQIAQPNLISNPNLAGQPNLMGNNPVNGAVMTNPQGQSNMYAIVPVNGQNAMPNPNSNNGAYFVPVQQVPSNAVLLNNGK